MTIEHFKLIPAVFLILIKNNQILLLRRFNTGYEDGKYTLPSGHLNGDEPATQAIAREAFEEVGIKVKPTDLKFAFLVHRPKDSKYPNDEERADIFFTTNTWSGVPQNMESEKCDHLGWFDINNLPSNIIPWVGKSIENYIKGERYLESGWKE